LKEWFDPAIRLSYSKTEIVNKVNEIKHPMIREAFRHFKLKSHLEMAILADLPAGTGMGSSGSFAVGLLNVLSNFKNKKQNPQTLAELAFRIQRNVLHEAGGKQDQYAAAFGGIISMKIKKNGSVEVKKLRVKPSIVRRLENRILCVYTGITRSAPKIQKKYSKSITLEKEKVIENLHQIKNMSKSMESFLVKGKLNEMGELFEDHWNAKKTLSKEITNNQIDRLHDLAISSGAIGGKMLGAGGGGYMLFLCKDGKREKVKKILNKSGLMDIPIRFNDSGSAIINKID